MRGDAALVARLLLRRAGLAGLTAAGGGIVAVLGASQPWYGLVATLEMLGASDDRIVASLRGWPGTAAGWVTASTGFLAVVLGVAIAVDRPPRWARAGLAGAALLVAAAAAIALVLVPDATTIAGPDATRYAMLAAEMPVGARLDLEPRALPAVWVSLGGAVLTAAGAAGARDL